MAVEQLRGLIDLFSLSADDIKTRRQQQLNTDEHVKYVALFDVERWYPLVAPLTFQTKFVPITIDEAEQLATIAEQADECKAVLKANEIAAWIMDQIDKTLATLLNRIQQTLDRWDLQHAQPENIVLINFFCKLSSRSPKDAVLHDYYVEKTKRFYVESLSKISKSTSMECTLNEKKIALNQAMIDCLKCRNAHEILFLFVQSSRICEDLKIALRQGPKIALRQIRQYDDGAQDNAWKWRQHVVIREWDNHLDVMYEFRGFVCNHSLTALSQYQHGERCAFLIQNKQHIERILRSYWHTHCKQLLSSMFEDYVIDFALIPPETKHRNDLHKWRVKIIELNPYSDDTGALLFSWNFDRKLLRDGPLEFRLQQLEFGEGDIRKLYPIHRKLLNVED